MRQNEGTLPEIWGSIGRNLVNRATPVVNMCYLSRKRKKSPCRQFGDWLLPSPEAGTITQGWKGWDHHPGVPDNRASIQRQHYQTSKSNGTCPARVWTCFGFVALFVLLVYPFWNGNVYSEPVSPLYFRIR